MAVSKLALSLISISALLFSTFCVDAVSVASAPAPAPSVQIEVSSTSIDPAELALPDFTGKDEVEVPVEKQSQAAKVVASQMQQVESKIAEFNAILKKRLDNPETSAETQECIKQCEEVYGAAQDDIKNSLESLNKENISKANFDISAVSTNVDTCNECFKEMVGEDPELQKFDEWVRGITEKALTTLENVSS